MPDIEIRTIEQDQYRDCLAVHEPTFGLAVDDEAVKRASAETELDRVFAAFDGTRIVATAQASSFTLTVPGGTVPMAGLGSAAVLPSHRRQGILAELTRRRFDQARERGDAVAGIWASESIRRGRWQFGCATAGCEVQLAQPYMELVDPVDPRGHVRLVSAGDALPAIARIHDRVRAVVPGMIDRSPARWSNWLDADPWHWLGDAWHADVSPRIFALWEDDRGYVVYRLQRRWSGGAAEYRVLIAELMAVDLEAYAGLWTWCFNLDLVRAMAASQRPVDDLLPLLLVDARRLQSRAWDALRLRPLDVRRALEARTYACDGEITLEVVDAAGPWAAGRYRLHVDGGHATCTTIDALPDVTLPAEALGSVYLGGERVTRLERAGMVTGHSPGAVERLDLMLRTSRAPWCTTVF